MLAVALILLAHLFNLSGIFLKSIIQGNDDVFFYYDYSVAWGGFVRLMVLACGFASGLVFIQDRQTEAFRYYVLRAGRKKYIFSRIFGSVLSSACAMALASLIVFILLRLSGLPWFESEIKLADLKNDLQGYVFASENVIFPIIYYCYTAFCFGCLWGMLALVSSTFTQNPFVVISSPLIFAQALSIVFSLLRADNELRPYDLLGGYYEISKLPFWQATWPFIITSIYLIPLGLLAYKRMERIIND